ncbi:MAG TPA: serine/threonine-protein kinase [Hyphomicrobiaceae bacterium]|nr:serine/threonine-protein kinase [Hyphomicrobiaceae bacterium]
MTQNALPLGAVLAGDYRITGILGQGGFGLTYKAEDTRLGAPVAIKEYFPSDMAVRLEDTTVRARSSREEQVFAWGRKKFLDEARTLARFRAPNIVRVARLFEANNTAYMVLDFEQGPSLAEWRASLGRPPTQSEIDHIARGICEAVATVHEAGVLHRDIKPANIIMRGGREPVLIDFGAARQSLGQRSRTVHAVVTPGYSPKEQYALDIDRQGAWTDIYAIGATLYFLMAGRAPPDALTRELGSPAPLPPDATAAYRPSFIAAVEAAMSPRAEDRPQTVRELADILFGQGELEHGAETIAFSDDDRAPQSALASDPRSSRPSVRSRPREVSFEDLQPASAATPRSSAAPRAIAVAILAATLGTGSWYWVQVAAPNRDEAAFAAARSADTVSAYDRYLSERPNGRYAPEARERRAVLSRPPSQAGSSAGLGITPPPGIAPPGQTTPPAPPPVPTPQPPASQPPPTTPAPPSGQAVAPPPGGSGSPQPPRTRQQPPPARAQLPAALTETDITRLRQSVTGAQIRLAHTVFAGSPFRGYSEQPGTLAVELERLTGGKAKLVSLAGADAVRDTDIASEARTATDFAVWNSPTRGISRNSAYAVFAGLPFGLGPAEHVEWLRQEGASLLEQLYWRDNIPYRVIPCGISSGPGGWFKREIKSPADFRGLKMRTYGLVTAVVGRLGAESVSVEASTQPLLTAFGDNSLDAFMALTHYVNTFVRRQPPAPVLHYPSWHQPSYMFELAVPVTTWQALGEPLQRLVDQACRANLDKWLADSIVTHRAIVDQARASNITVRPFTGPVLEALRAAAEQVLADEAARNPEFANALASYNRFRR